MSNQPAQTLESSSETNVSVRYLTWLQCPNCSSKALSLDNLQISCNKCHTQYPCISSNNTSIPLLFSRPLDAIQGWSARLNGFTHKNLQKITELKKSLKDKRISKSTRQRIKSLLQAKQGFGQQISEQLQFFGQHNFNQDITANSALAQNQGVDSYINNIFRDWSWENGENEELMQALQIVCPIKDFSAGNVLTLGAGAGRFSFDFHHQYSANYSTLLDINPFLLTVASRIIGGESIPLYEFPIAPTAGDCYSILQNCKLPDGFGDKQAEKFDYILADVSNVPFAENSFDTVLTPWLIDIIPLDLRDFIPHVNRLLKTGGTWLNTGSLAFFHKNESWNYSEEEVIDLLKKYGFEIVKTDRKQVKYMQSPYSAHGRVENIFSFSAKKKFDSIPAKPFKYLPDWITDRTHAIPQSNGLTAISSKHLLQAQVLSAIDGVRSINTIGKLLAKQYGMSEESACAAVRQILIDNYQENT